MFRPDSESILQFLSDFYSGNGLHHIMQTVYKYFENPCAIYDMNYSPIAFIGNGDEADRIWSETVNDGRLSEKTIEGFIEDRLLSPQHKILFPYFEPAFFAAGDDFSRRLGVAFSSGSSSDTESMWLVVFEHNRTISEQDVELITWLSKILVPVVDAITSKKVYSLGRIDSLLLDVLNESADLSTVEERLRLLGWTLPERSVALVAKPRDDVVHEPVRDYVVSRIGHIADDVLHLNYNGYLVLICTLSKRKHKEEITAEFDEIFAKYDLYGGISAFLTDIKKLKDAVVQGIHGIHIGQEKATRVIWFEDHIIDVLLLNASAHFDLSPYVHPMLLKLQAHDRANQTDYLETLRHFISCSGNMKAAAQALWIHRNTMSYRMEKIADLLCVDSFSQNLISELQTAFKIFDIIDV